MSPDAHPEALPPEKPPAVEARIAVLEQENASLKKQLAWFQKQLFGPKSEKRSVEENPHQLPLSGLVGAPVEPLPEPEKETITYQRGKNKKNRNVDCVTDSGLRFGPEVPVTVIPVELPELVGEEADQYEVIDIRRTYRLAQRPASYEVLCYERPVIKRKSTQALITAPAPINVLDGSLADVSFLVGMLVDKFLYHLPLYRQHQRLQQAGIDLSRATLTNLVKRSIELLRPIVEAQLAHILLSRVLSIDETPIKAGLNKKKGAMKQAWFWPVMGDAGEIVFTYSNSRGRQHIERLLAQQFDGTLVSDGYAAYASYVKANEQLTHAQCWVHGRRYFVEAEDSEPAEVGQALDAIGALYHVEKQLRELQLVGEKKRQYRLKHSKPIVDDLFAWFEAQRQRPELLPSNPFSRAIEYMRRREPALRVFLEDPDVPMDNNHTERALRPIALGRNYAQFAIM